MPSQVCLFCYLEKVDFDFIVHCGIMKKCQLQIIADKIEVNMLALNPLNTLKLLECNLKGKGKTVLVLMHKCSSVSRA